MSDKKVQITGLMLGFNVILCLAIGIGGGLSLDSSQGTSPRWLLVGIGTSILMIILLFVKYIKLANASDEDATEK